MMKLTECYLRPAAIHTVTSTKSSDQSGRFPAYLAVLAFPLKFSLPSWTLHRAMTLLPGRGKPFSRLNREVYASAHLDGVVSAAYRDCQQ